MTKATFRSQDVRTELRRILRRDIRKIIGCLRGISAATPEAIAEAVQRLKRLRALNQTLQPSYSILYRQNDRFYRGLVVMLPGDDDRQLLYSALQTLLFQRPDLVRDPVTCFLLEQCGGDENHHQRFTPENPTVSVSKVVRQRLADHLSGECYAPPADFGEPELLAGVRASYSRCRRLGKKVMATDNPGSLVRWNCYVESLFYQLGALHCPTDGLMPLQRGAGKLSELLSRDYRLALLRERLRKVRTNNPQLLLDAIVDERQLCRLEMETLGEQLFAPEADWFMGQVRAAWGQRWV